MRTIISKDFEVKKLREGTKADFLVRPLGSEEDDWIAVQLKSTEKKKDRYDTYAFTTKTDYSGMVLLCVCVKDEKIWIFDGEISKNVCGLGLNKTSKYNYGYVEKDEVNIKMAEFWEKETIEKVTYEEANVPRAVGHQKEYEFQKLRERHLGHGLSFEYPELECQVFDFNINGYKVQEKVGIDIHRKEYDKMYVTLGKNIGCKSTKGSYEKGDNDFYWIASQDKDTFYVFPESILIEKGYVKSEDNTNASTRLLFEYQYREGSDWTLQYQYKYSNLDIKKLTELFQ
jgi:hypothetical protein